MRRTCFAEYTKEGLAMMACEKLRLLNVADTDGPNTEYVLHPRYHL